MDPILLQADELGIRLEIVGGLPIWEAKPLIRHQRAIDRLRDSIHRDGVTRQISPVMIDLECGCRCEV